MSMNITKLAKNLVSKTSTIPKTTQYFFQLDWIQDWNHCVVLFQKLVFAQPRKSSNYKLY